LRIHYKCIIAGAGPAGLVTALLLKKAGARVLVLERRKNFLEKPCGGGVSPRAVRLINKLGLKLSLGAPSLTVEGNSPPWHYNRFTLKRPAMSVVRRYDFNKSLLKEAEKQGVEVRISHLRDVSFNGRDFSLHTEKGDFTANYIVGADGPNSRVRRALGGKVPFFARAIMADNITSPKNPDHIIFDGNPAGQGYGWVFPYGDGRANAGVYTISNIKGPKFRKSLHNYLKARLGIDSRKVNITGGLCPWGGYELPRGVPAILVGDAGGFIDPMTGEGIFHALYTARAAARAILSSSPDSARAAYEKNIRSFLLNTALLRFICPRVYSLPRQGGLLLGLSPIHRLIIEGLVRGYNTSAFASLFPGLFLVSLLNPALVKYEYNGNLPLDKAP